MWYHYLAMAIGAYLVGMGLWYLFTNKTRFNGLGWVMWSIPRLIGLALLWWGYSGISAPPMMGGKRRWY